MPTSVLSELELSVIQQTNEEHMNDVAHIMQRVDSVDSYGQPVPTWSAMHSNVPCSFEPSPFKFRAREVTSPGAETSEILVRARFPLSYYDDITQEKRIRLIKRFGVTLTTPEDYDVQGFVERQAFGINVNLKRVEP